MADVIVIGAGVAGCLGARALTAAGHAVTVLDKGFVPGGRLASKNLEGATFDTGAQFLTARSESFRAEVDRWEAAGVLRTWFHGSPDLDAPNDPDGHPRFRGAPTMRRLAEHLADGLDLWLGTIVRSTSRDRDKEQTGGLGGAGQGGSGHDRKADRDLTPDELQDWMKTFGFDPPER